MWDSATATRLGSDFAQRRREPQNNFHLHLEDRRKKGLSTRSLTFITSNPDKRRTIIAAFGRTLSTILSRPPVLVTISPDKTAQTSVVSRHTYFEFVWANRPGRACFRRVGLLFHDSL